MSRYKSVGPIVTIEALNGIGASAEWFDMTCDIQAARVRRGRTAGGPQAWMNRINAGELVLTLNNESGRYSQFDPDLNLALINENTYIRVRANWKNVDYCIGGFYVEQWEENWTAVTDEIVIVCVDALAFMSEQGSEFEWVPGAAGQSIPKRLEQLLTRAGQRGVPFYADADRDVTCISPLLDRTRVLDEIHKTALSGNGVLFHEPISPIPGVDVLAPDDSYVYLGPSRFESVLAAFGEATPMTADPTTASDWRLVSGPLDRAQSGTSRRAQGEVPVFSDNCILESGTHEYVDIQWQYIGYERPSTLAVANRRPPTERDAEGNEIPPPWTEAKAQVHSSEATRHKVIEITDLRFSNDNQASYVAQTMMQQLAEPKLEVSRLRLFPHFDERQFDALMVLRMQDHVLTIRNLLHSGQGTAIGPNGRRIEIDSLVEGFEYRLTPDGSDVDGQVRWDTTIILSPLVADVLDIEIAPPKPTDPSVHVYVVSPEGSAAGAGLTATSIDEAARLVYLSFTSNAQQTPTPDNLRAFAVHSDLVTREAVSFTSIDVSGSAGAWKATGVFSLDRLLEGRQYRLGVYEPKPPNSESNTVILHTPHPVPPKPSIGRQSAWEGGLPAGATSAPTGIKWAHTQGARYDVGRADSLTGTLAIVRSNQSATIHNDDLDLDHDYSYAIRYSGTTDWGPRLKIRTGHPAKIEIKENVNLGTTPDVPSGTRPPSDVLQMTVPLIKPPGPNSTGDAWPTTPAITYDGRYLVDANGAPGGFIGTKITNMKMHVVKQPPPLGDHTLSGENVDDPSRVQLITLYVKGVKPNIFDPAWSWTNVQRIPNPSWQPDPPHDSRKQVPMTVWVTDGVPPGSSQTAAQMRDGRMGIVIAGLGFSFPNGDRLAGNVTFFGTTATGTNFERNKVIP